MKSVRTEAVVFRPGGGTTMEELAVREPRGNEVRVAIRSSGVCHSDLHIVKGEWEADRPIVLGHEAAGVVEAVGETASLRIGQHVVLSWFAPCGECRGCRSGRTWLCSGTLALQNALPGGSTAFEAADGSEVWPYLGLGAFAGRIIAPEQAVVPVPEELPFDIGALLGCSVTTGIGAVVNTAQVEAQASAAVIGCGGVGLSIVMGLALAGAKEIVAIDRSFERLERAREFGATRTIVAGEQDAELDAYVQRAGGFDYVFEAIGRQETIEQMLPMLAPGGAAVLVGMTPDGVRVSLDPFAIADQGLRVLGCNYGSSVASQDIPRFAEMYLQGKLPLDRLIGARRPLAEAQAALDDLADARGLRTVLHP